VLLHIAELAGRFAPEVEPWSWLRQHLPPRPVPRTDALPHWSRLVSHTGVTANGGPPRTDWLCRHDNRYRHLTKIARYENDLADIRFLRQEPRYFENKALREVGVGQNRFYPGRMFSRLCQLRGSKSAFKVMGWPDRQWGQSESANRPQDFALKGPQKPRPSKVFPFLIRLSEFGSGSCSDVNADFQPTCERRKICATHGKTTSQFREFY
jgi:hypothetical protein